MERRSALSVGGVHISTLRDEVRHDLRVPGVCGSIYERRPAVLIRLIDIQTLLHGLANRDDPCARACRTALPPLRSVPVAAHEARGHAGGGVAGGADERAQSRDLQGRQHGARIRGVLDDEMYKCYTIMCIGSGAVSEVWRPRTDDGEQFLSAVAAAQRAPIRDSFRVCESIMPHISCRSPITK